MIPVVFIHKGGVKNDSGYLRHALQLASRRNSEVVLIGDSNDLPHIPIGDYLPRGEEFTQLYQHMNTNPEEFELFCFQRWFVLLEFMERENVDTCLHLDSDVLLFADAQEEWAGYQQYAFTLSSGHCAHTSFFTKPGLSAFCDYLLESYSAMSPLNKQLTRIHAEMVEQQLPGGICDMTLFQLFKDRGAWPIGEMTEVVDGKTWDHNMRVNHGYRMLEWHDEDLVDEQLKDIRFAGGVPHAWLTDQKRWIRFNSLHFQGHAKRLVGKYARGESLSERTELEPPIPLP